MTVPARFLKPCRFINQVAYLQGPQDFAGNQDDKVEKWKLSVYLSLFLSNEF